jgi:hypothetical protein
VCRDVKDAKESLRADHPGVESPVLPGLPRPSRWPVAGTAAEIQPAGAFSMLRAGQNQTRRAAEVWRNQPFCREAR